ncbi:MAG: DUF2953 domain-containing protein [Eubacterium sp.]|nr:DUF2953 domain-containing protein [Eubacterium sp.]
MIILTILKWIGIVVLIVLGLILGLILLLLFVPFRYKVSVAHPAMGEKIKYGFRVSWALRFLSVKKKLDEERIVLRILGIPIFKMNDKKNETEEADEIIIDEEKAAKKEEKEQQKAIKIEEKAIKKEEKEARQEEKIQIREEKREAKRRKKEGYVPEPVREPSAFEKFVKKIKDKVNGIKKKILDTLAKIRLVFRKISVIIEFVRDKTTKSVFKKLMKETVKLIKYVGPKKIKGQLCFGTGDPSSTGMILAGVSLCPAVYKKGVSVTPDFEEKCITGYGDVYGRIRIIYFVRLAIRVYFDKEFRRTYKRLKKINREVK